MVKVATHDTNPDGGGGIDKNGEYHFTIESYEDGGFSSDDSPQFRIEFQCHAGTESGQAGKKFSDFFPYAGKRAGRFLQLACAVGLITKEQWKAAKEGNADIEIDENDLIGRQLCMGVTMEPYKGKNEEKAQQYQGRLFPNVGFNIWGVFDDRSAKIPKDPTLMKMLKAPASTTQQPAKQQPAATQQPARQTQPAQQPAGAATDGSDPWGGF